MTTATETCLVAVMALAVFTAVTAPGGSLVPGIGYERLLAGFEVIKQSDELLY